MWHNYVHSATYSLLSHKEPAPSGTTVHPCLAKSGLRIIVYILYHLVANSNLQPRGRLVGREDHSANSQTAFGQTELYIPLKMDLPHL